MVIDHNQTMLNNNSLKAIVPTQIIVSRNIKDSGSLNMYIEVSGYNIWLV